MAMSNNPKFTRGEHFLSYSLIVGCILVILVSISFSICPRPRSRDYGDDIKEDEEYLEPGRHDKMDRIVAGKLGHKNVGALSLKHGDHDYFFICNAYKVDKLWYLTTAECVSHLQNSPKLVIRTNISSWAEHSVDFKVSEFIPLGTYNEMSLENNIGLVKIDQNRLVRSAPKSSDAALEEGLKKDTFWTIGWAKKADGEVEGCIIVKELKQIDDEDCKEIIKKKYQFPCNNVVCMVPVKNEEDVCLPDKGAVLLYSSKVHGVKSFGDSCVSDFPQVYIQVNSYMDWINRHTIPG